MNKENSCRDLERPLYVERVRVTSTKRCSGGVVVDAGGRDSIPLIGTDLLKQVVAAPLSYSRQQV